MKIVKIFALFALFFAPSVWAAADYHIKYRSNYVMPAYVHFQATGSQYRINAKINVPLYNIEFASRGAQTKTQFKMVNYQDVRNGKTYAMSKMSPDSIEYGKLKDGLKTEPLKLPTFDLFTMAFQLAYYDALPPNFQITNGKKLYSMENIRLNKSEKTVKQNGNQFTEITYTFRTGNKDIMVKKFAGEQFPRYLKYSRDGDDYELTFSEFVK